MKEIEPEGTALFKKEIKNCKYFVDVGAEKGHYTKLAMKNMEEGFIVAIEPEKDRWNTLQKMIQNFKNEKLKVVGLKTCVGDSIGEITLYRGSTPSVLKKNSKIKKRLLNDKVTVKIDTLDHLFEDKEVDFIKIDVEGYELSVLKGAANILKKHKPKLLLEVHPKFLELNDIEPKEIYDLLDLYDYKYKQLSYIKNDVTGNIVELYFCY